MSDNLLIGMVESEDPIEDQFSDCLSFRVNKIGGYPVLSPLSNAETICSFNSFVCDLCEKQLTFVLQIYCPIDNSKTDRLIHLFVCLNSDCNQNKWFAFRSVTPLVEERHQKQANSVKNSDWIEGETDWGNEEISESPEGAVKSCIVSMSDLSVQCIEPNPKYVSLTAKSMAYFRPLYVSVIEEPTDGLRDDKHINQLIESYEKQNETQNNEKIICNSNENFENSFQSVYRNDRKNYQFFKRLALFPKQIIRYQWMGTPLVNSDSHIISVPKCKACGADTSFEFQLMPALISYLKPLSAGDSGLQLDFGTVLIYTCGNNCVINGSLSAEHCIVLSDPDNQFIDKINDK